MRRVSVVARESAGALLASVGNLLDDVPRLTLFQCTTQALLTTVMEGTYADTWRPIRHAHGFHVLGRTTLMSRRIDECTDGMVGCCPKCMALILH
jgi:hypothetical protein